MKITLIEVGNKEEVVILTKSILCYKRKIKFWARGVGISGPGEYKINLF